MMGYNFIQPNQFNTPTDPSSVGSDADSSGLLSRWQPPSSESSRNQLVYKTNYKSTIQYRVIMDLKIAMPSIILSIALNMRRKECREIMVN